ncbi:NUDIX hydrolase [Peptostreptococcus sp. MV1]|nr:NUDIX hydrolase [Peptostreptococcus sp. MV1]
MKLPKIKKIISVYKSKFLNVFEVDYKDKMENDKKWIVASRMSEKDYTDKILNNRKSDGVDAVIIVGYKTIDGVQDAIVVIKEFRIPINDYIYSLPAGLVYPGDDIYDTAIREMREETGLILSKIDKGRTCNKAYASVGMSDESLAIVYGNVEGNLSKAYMEDTELIEPMYMTRKDVRDLLNRKDVNIDIKAWLILREFAGC